MGNKRHKPEEIITKLRQVEVLVGQGMARVDAIREVRMPILSPQAGTYVSDHVVETFGFLGLSWKTTGASPPYWLGSGWNSGMRSGRNKGQFHDITSHRCSGPCKGHF